MSNHFLANRLVNDTKGKFESKNNGNQSFVSIFKKDYGPSLRIRSAKNEIIFHETEKYDYEYFIGEIYNKSALNKSKYVLLKHTNGYEIIDESTNTVIKHGHCIPFKKCTVYTYNALLQKLNKL